MNVRPFPPREPYDHEQEDWDPTEGAWLPLAFICGFSGAIVGAIIVGLVWWLS